MKSKFQQFMVSWTSCEKEEEKVKRLGRGLFDREVYSNQRRASRGAVQTPEVIHRALLEEIELRGPGGDSKCLGAGRGIDDPGSVALDSASFFLKRSVSGRSNPCSIEFGAMGS